MISLEELLKMPRSCKREVFWERLTKGETLFSALCQAVRNRSVDQAMRWAETWQQFMNSSNQGQRDVVRAQRQWDIVRALVWCADQAVNNPQFHRNEVERSILALSIEMNPPPDYIKNKKSWALGCIRTYLPNIPVRGQSLYIPIVGWDKQTKTGSLCTLVLDVLEGGEGNVFHHPIDAFTTFSDNEFSESIKDGWIAANKLLDKEGMKVLSEGRWRVLLQDGKPVPVVSGRSASGAAALGWYHKLKDTVYDEGVIVLAQVDKDGILEGVGGLTAKVKAIAENTALDWHIDTIVVASKDNEIEAKTALKSLHMDDVIKVVNLDANNT